jgi:sporulation protein YlmC with PRC-barrel domain
MRIRYQKLKGMEVLADREGRLLGSVRRLQLDSKKRAAVGLVFRGKLMSGEHWTRVSGIERVGQDVVFLTAMRAVRDDEPSGRDVKDMLGLPVMSMDGRRLGSLEDVVLETENWQIAGIVLDSGGAVEVGGDAVFGEDTILLRAGAGDEVVEDIEGQGGFLARVFQGEGESSGGSGKSASKNKPAKKAAKKPAKKAAAKSSARSTAKSARKKK